MIIPIFIMNSGCPHRCIFCNERLTAGNHPTLITEKAFREKIETHLESNPRVRGNVQIAFYGGTFTGISDKEQKRLLDLAAPFLRGGKVSGIRISTRPDEISRDNLLFLKQAGVTTVEIGIQSFDDEVLQLSHRGHTAADNVRAVQLLKEAGLETGVHLMAGLPGDNPERFGKTIEKTIALAPDTVRIHPTLVLENTALAVEFRAGRYLPLQLTEAIALCRLALQKFTEAGIAVIRLGLQTTRELEEPGAVVAGPFHPAFRTLVETAIFLEMAEKLLAATHHRPKEVTFIVAAGDVSNITGIKRENISLLKKKFGLEKIRISTDSALPRGRLAILHEGRKLTTDFSTRITILKTVGIT